MWIKREIEETLARVARQRPSLILTGARQTGKTSLLRRIFPKYGYVTLDIPLQAEEAEESGQSFLARHPAPLIIDEVQYAPELLRYIKVAVDDNRDQNGQYCITGSQKFSLMAGVTESLAGRAAILECHSLSAREYKEWKQCSMGRETLLLWMWTGGYPEIHANSLDPERFFTDYLATYLERDVRQILQVRSLRDFERFLRLCAVRTGQLMSYNTFATDIGVSPNTIKSWVSILEASNILYLLEPYYQNLGKRIVKTPKMYFLDSGLACFLAGIRSPKELGNSQLIGPIFETHVLGQIIRHFANRGVAANINFYRDHYGHEVDFLIPVGDAFQLFECKWSEKPSLRVPGFNEIEKLVGSKRIIRRSLISPEEGMRQTSSGIIVEDSITLHSLSADHGAGYPL